MFRKPGLELWPEVPDEAERCRQREVRASICFMSISSGWAVGLDDQSAGVGKWQALVFQVVFQFLVTLLKGIAQAFLLAVFDNVNNIPDDKESPKANSHSTFNSCNGYNGFLG